MGNRSPVTELWARGDPSSLDLKSSGLTLSLNNIHNNNNNDIYPHEKMSIRLLSCILHNLIFKLSI